ncbi:MAG: response regulator transcription factor [Trueperaceae bacterium]|jgi:DNA-binding response OmpR family regulator|nr:response regulator transcription factor [Truepera sp.]HRN18401.1 response regulator transcription factor [Trueperaceae bacterium]HRQ09953.1 response regulator transcription factor [Trueperaceae bacterium]
MVTKRILIVEDDVDILRLLSRELEDAGFEVLAYDSGMRGLTAVRESNPDLVILDLGLPDISGQEIARRLRHTGNIPIIILTAADEVGTKVEMLNAGADDYLAKPFHVEELVARVNVQLRKRTLGVAQKIGELTIDPARRQVFWVAEEIRFSPREYELLHYLAGQPGRVYSRKEIENNVWGEELPPSSNVVDVHIANIRGKLRDAGGYGVIRTVRGVGYALKS